ncbi:mechanosensitive ion channel family protein [Clostridium lundense]|uniref:mechanosensitive ion channel family protein n=1 Tax=Clostridium lundense TaxID=319475 RepID=UPI00054FA6D3|nr:mechanosensitive ion channel domain-containing protein [Clostridium lundense]
MDQLKSISLKFQAVGTLPKFVLTIILLIGLYIINKAVVNFINNINWSSQRTIKFKKACSAFIKIIFFVLITPIWVYESKDILTFLGLFSAGMAFAFKDLVSSFLGWVIINSHKPFVVGDRIKIGDSVGDVLQIDWFYTTIIEVTQNNKIYGQSTGRLTNIPNIKILSAEVISETSTFPYTWNEIQFNLSLDSNWQKAKEIIINVAGKEIGNIQDEVKESLDVASKTHPIYYQNLSHTVYTSIDLGKIVLTLRFICGSRNFRNLEHSIVESVLIEFKKYDDVQLI